MCERVRDMDAYACKHKHPTLSGWVHRVCVGSRYAVALAGSEAFFASDFLAVGLEASVVGFT